MIGVRKAETEEDLEGWIRVRRAVSAGEQVVTWTQQGNEGKPRLNERFGYEYRAVSVVMAAQLPLQRTV
jgi:hypothetical protein